VPGDAEVLFLERAILKDLLSAEFVAAMHAAHRVDDLREVDALLDGGVPAAHHDDVLALVEEPIAGGAVAHAARAVLLLAGHSKVTWVAAGAVDAGPTAELVVAVGVGGEGAVLLAGDLLHVGVGDFDTQGGHVLGHLLSELRPLGMDDA